MNHNSADLTQQAFNTVKKPLSNQASNRYKRICENLHDAQAKLAEYLEYLPETSNLTKKEKEEYQERIEEERGYIASLREILRVEYPQYYN